MKHRSYLFALVFIMAFVLLSGITDSEDNSSNIDLLMEDDYPEDLDTLEEFIQSYYLLLDSEAYLDKYKFVNSSKNKLHNDEKAMSSFYQKLLELRNGKRDRVVVYQLGDSHIQSGYFSGTARSALQKYYGNAGRGLVFPLRLAGTNQPDDYRFYNGASFSRIDKPRGVAGYTLSVKTPGSLKVKTNNFFGVDCRFDSAKLYYQGVSDSLKWQELHIPNSDPLSEMDIPINDSVKQLYGICLGREEAGLLYHSAGINGAGFYNLKDEVQMFTQMAVLKPDLIVISLGTNDAQGRYRGEVMESNLKAFMKNFRLANPTVPVLFTLPPDSYKAKKANPDLAKVEKCIIDYAKANSCAYWDLSEVMGGKGSIKKWREQQMAGKDMLHYTPKGYMLQGHLLYQAIIKAYKRSSEGIQR